MELSDRTKEIIKARKKRAEHENSKQLRRKKSYCIHINENTGFGNIVQELLYQAGYDWLTRATPKHRTHIKYLIFYPEDKMIFRSFDNPLESEERIKNVDYTLITFRELKQILE